jgi:hypothetical protein
MQTEHLNSHVRKTEMAKTTFSGPVQSNGGFMTPVVPTPNVSTTLTAAQTGGDYVILATADGGPAAPITITLPVVVGTSTNPDPRFNGLRGGLFNADTVLTHVVAAASGQTVNGAASVNVPPLHFAEWIGNGNQNAPWLCRISPLVSASA